MVNYFPIILATFFGLIPTILWLWFFLGEDKNPESKKTIIEVFLYGMVFALIALYFLNYLKSYFTYHEFGFALLFLGIILVPFIEEITKYLSFRFTALKHHELDEPVDFMIYMITAALGFAAMENILMSFSLTHETNLIESMFFLNIVRLVGANFLHALCSAILGYFLALSFYRLKDKKRLILIGFTLATLLHISFNLIMMNVTQAESLNNFILYFSLLIMLLLGTFILVLQCFRKLKKLKSICLMNS